MKLCMNEIAWLVQHSPWPTEHHQTVVAVSWAESKGDTEAIGTNVSTRDTTKPSGWTDLSASQDLGLLSINNFWHAANKMVPRHLDWRDPEDNLVLGWLVWNEGKSWTKWSTFNKGLHLPFMPGAATALRAPLQPPATQPRANGILSDQIQSLLGATQEIGGAILVPVQEIRRHFS